MCTPETKIKDKERRTTAVSTSYLRCVWTQECWNSESYATYSGQRLQWFNKKGRRLRGTLVSVGMNWDGVWTWHIRPELVHPTCGVCKHKSAEIANHTLRIQDSAYNGSPQRPQAAWYICQFGHELGRSVNVAYTPRIEHRAGYCRTLESKPNLGVKTGAC